MFEAGAVGHAAAGVGKDLHFGRVGMHGVRKPDILADPIQRLHVSHRAVAELLHAEDFLVLGLGQVGVQVDAVLARQHGALAHQVAGDAEGRAGGQDDLQHRAGFGVVVGFDQALRVGQDALFAVDDAVRGQAALALAQAHRAARGVQAQPHFARRGDLVVQARAVGEEVEVVGGGGAAGKGQLGQGGLRGDEDVLRVQARPDRVKRLQPVEQVGVLGGRHGAGQGLVKVMVGVDQPGEDEVPAQVENLVGSGGRSAHGPTCSIKPSRANRPPPGISRRRSSMVTRTEAFLTRSVVIGFLVV